jgi:hypothetical protein
MYGRLAVGQHGSKRGQSKPVTVLKTEAECFTFAFGKGEPNDEARHTKTSYTNVQIDTAPSNSRSINIRVRFLEF